MKIAFISNFLNDHQLPFCTAMINKIGVDNFRFIATTRMDADRVEMSFRDMNEEYPFVIKAYDPNFEDEAYSVAYEYDVIIIGSASDKYIQQRLKSHKLTFRYYERIYKKPLEWRYYPSELFYSILKNHRKNLYLLAAGAFCSYDFSKTFSFINKSFKWGYFPQTKIYPDIEDAFLFKQKDILGLKHNTAVSILWVGRMIDWKHPELPILLAKQLKLGGYSFHINMVGTGAKYQDIIRLINKEDVKDEVSLLGPMSPQKVREHMEASDIFIFTSDKNEGWGAVLNESMNSACAVVASRSIGAVPYLISNGVNGVSFENGDVNDLYSKVVELVNSPDLRQEYGRNAYKTIVNEWNANVACERFLNLIQCLSNRQASPYKSGLCSKAEIIQG